MTKTLPCTSDTRQAELFPAVAPAVDPQLSFEPDRAPDFYNMIAVDRGSPIGWRWYSLQALGEDRKTGAVVVKGGVFSQLITRGPRKGQTNFRKAAPGTERELVVTFANLDARIERWEAETGLCRDCNGTGRKFASCGPEGRTTRPCTRHERCRSSSSVG